MAYVEEIGSYYLKTQQEIDAIKKQMSKLKSFCIHNKLIIASNKQQQQYYQLQEHLKILEDNIQSANKQYYDQLINNFDITAQRLPTVMDKSNLMKRQDNTQINLPMIESIINVKSVPNINIEPIGKGTLKPKGIFQVRSAASLGRKQQKMTNNSKDAITQNTSKVGLLELVNQGKVEKDQVQQIFQSNLILKHSQSNLSQGSLQFARKQIQLVGATNQILFKTDLKSQQNNDVSQQDKNSIKIPITTKSSNNDSKEQILEQSQFNKTSNQNYNQSQQYRYTDSKANFLLIIQNDQFIYDDNYKQFHSQNMEQWENNIEPIMKSLVKLIQESKIKEATLQSNSILQLKNLMMQQKVFTLSQLVQIFDNWEEIAIKLQIPQLIYKTKDGKLKAVIKIQSKYRQYKAQKDYHRLKVMIEKVLVIQQYIRIFLFKQQTKKHIQENNVFIIDKFKQKQRIFKQEWDIIKQSKRYEIHINSFSYQEIKRLSMDKMQQKQNVQITRIFNLKDPNIYIIYICDIPQEVIDYFYKILQLGEINDVRSRLYFVKPENQSTFPSHMSLSQTLLYSPKSLKRIKQLIKGNTSYLIPGYPSNDDIKLADILNIPIYGGLPQLHQYYTTKSGCKQLFEELQLPQPQSIRNIYDEKELINSLAVLIQKNPSINIWILKIDDETQGRGIAWMDVRKMVKQDVVNIIQKLRIVYPQLYKSYDEYLLHFTTRGGIIEACPCSPVKVQSPCIHFQIEPNGELQILGTYDKVKTNEFQTVSHISPQQSLKINLEYLLQGICKKLYSKGLFGYFTIDLIAYQEQSKINFQMIGLDCFLNNFSSSLIYYDFLMKGKLDQITGEYYVEEQNKQESRIQIFCPFIINEGLDVLQYKTFFQLCRLESISFNLEKKIGSTFILIDSLQSGIISLMTVGVNYQQRQHFYRRMQAEEQNNSRLIQGVIRQT
ncbi:hypothetical protein pb186bvf_014318 [Paramecium bursaria]